MKTHSFATTHPAAEYLRSVHAAELAQEKADEAAKKQLWKRSRAGRGMLIGGVGGAVAGGALGRMAGHRGISGALLGGALGATGGEIMGALVRRNPKNDLSAVVESLVALERRTDVLLFGVDLKREEVKPPSPCGSGSCDVTRPSYPTVFLRLEGERAASLAHIKNGDEVILKGKVVSVEVRDRQGDGEPISSRSVDIECHELLPDAAPAKKDDKDKKPASDEKKGTALDACDRPAPGGMVELGLTNYRPIAKSLGRGLGRFAGRAGLPFALGAGALGLGALARHPDDNRPHPFRAAAGVAAGALGAAAIGTAANRFVQGRYGNQGLDSWRTAADEAKLRFRSAWGAPRLAATPPVVGAPTVDAAPPGGVGPLAAGVKPAVGGVASTRRAMGFKQVPAGMLAKEARDAGRRHMQNLLGGPLLPKQRFGNRRRIVTFGRARNGDGQFEPGTQAPDPGTMAAAYPAAAPQHPNVSNLIAAAHRRRIKRDLLAGGIGAAAGAAAGAGAMPAWQYLRSVMAR